MPGTTQETSSALFEGARTGVARLGIGTSALAGRVSRKESLRILETAFDAGISHIDTAAMYGYGAAEGVVGEFLRGKQGKVTVATKFGIEPPKKTALMSMAKAAAKVAISVVPSVRAKIAKRVNTMVSKGNFNVAHAQMSLERSLAALGTASIDTLLMHEASLDEITPELTDYLQQKVADGTLASYGVACTNAETPRILRSGKPFGRVLQMPDQSVAVARELAAPEVLLITHSIFNTKFKNFVEAVAKDDALASRCSAAMGFDGRDGRRLGRLFLWNSMRRNPGGLVIFSSLSAEAIRKNAALMHGTEFTAEQGDALDRLLAAELAVPAEGGPVA